MRAPLIVLIAICGALALPVHASAKFPYTHSVSVKGSIVDNWTISNPETCASQGAGTVSVDYASKGRIRIHPFIAKFAARPHSKKPGNWILGVPGGGGVTHLGSKPATGTSTHIDNTTQNPQDAMTTSPCLPADKSACGSTPIKRGNFTISTLDPKSIAVSFSGDPGYNFFGGCLNGALEGWKFPATVVGGTKIYGEIVLTMPTARTLKRKRSVTITATVHKLSAGPRSEGGTESVTDDVTRHVSVTFTKL